MLSSSSREIVGFQGFSPCTIIGPLIAELRFSRNMKENPKYYQKKPTLYKPDATLFWDRLPLDNCHLGALEAFFSAP